MKSMILKKLISIVFIVVILFICVNLIIDVLDSQNKMVQDSETLFAQIKLILSENQNEKNELSHIFSLLTENEGDTLYAADKDTRIILGSTDTDTIGKTLSDVGFDEYYVSTDKDGFHDVINGADVFCVFAEIDGIVIGRACTTSTMYHEIPKNLLTVSLFTLLIAAFLVITVSNYLNIHIVQGIAEVNVKLKEITDGNLDERIKVDNTPEFTELSEHINIMIASVLSTTNKMSHILDRVQLPIGVYEYNKKMAGVRATKQLPAILGLDDTDAKTLLSDNKAFEKALDELRKYPLENFENTYILTDNTNLRYIRMETFSEDNSILGILVDDTNDISECLRLEAERDTDMLTGLYNRKGLDVRIDKLFETPDVISHGAVIMLDADGLKDINDQYGHNAGDRYLCEIANIIRQLSPATSILSRQGGDEFVLFFYGCKSEAELITYIDNLKAISDNRSFVTEDGIVITLRYSLGYVMYDNSKTTFNEMLIEADEIMYRNKRVRKGVE